ncbi:hypothetical protein PENTCL1PPCAC_21459 [Pristionchus entomophagus]|uniref:C-type lectin domain-containing protein n=1 Tax=Pristionchus entomophagus TaxID=358040 RepID=A0AAV5TXT3_9BILA|nr:hypothetical protein PENTCL1PPCAC_21459 [Pristionchus entomophagus]
MFDDGLKSKPGRAITRQVIYYITDSDSKNDLSSLNEFKASMGVIIFNNFLQKGEVERPSLKALASPGFYFLNNNYMEGLQAFCKANCFCQPDKDAYGGSDQAMQASGGCYHATSAGVPFNKAKTTCSNEGGILTSNHDAAKGRFLYHLMSSTSSKSDYFWIGYQKSDDGVWKWDDQASDPYTNWGVGEPSTAAVAKCAYVDSTTSNLSWGAGNCQLGFPYVCQYRPCTVGYKDC